MSIFQDKTEMPSRPQDVVKTDQAPNESPHTNTFLSTRLNHDASVVNQPARHHGGCHY